MKNIFLSSMDAFSRIKSLLNKNILLSDEVKKTVVSQFKNISNPQQKYLEKLLENALKKQNMIFNQALNKKPDLEKDLQKIFHEGKKEQNKENESIQKSEDQKIMEALEKSLHLS